MLRASVSSITATWNPAGDRLPSSSPLSADALSMLVLRFAAHLPYFKAASMLALPQGLSNAGVVVMTFVYALACMTASRWLIGLRREGTVLAHPAVLPLLGATAVFIAMMVMGPVIATLLPRHPELASSAGSLLPACLCLLAPACGVFFAAQYYTSPRRTAP